MHILIGSAIVCGLTVLAFGLENARNIFRWMIAACFAGIAILILSLAGDKNGWFVIASLVFMTLAYITAKSGRADD